MIKIYRLLRSGQRHKQYIKYSHRFNLYTRSSNCTRLHRWCLELICNFIPHFIGEVITSVGLKLNHVCKRGPWQHSVARYYTIREVMFSVIPVLDKGILSVMYVDWDQLHLSPLMFCISFQHSIRPCNGWFCCSSKSENFLKNWTSFATFEITCYHLDRFNYMNNNVIDNVDTIY